MTVAGICICQEGVLGPECADAQSHTSGARLPKNLDESEPKKNLDESEEPTDLTQPQQKEKQHHSDSYFTLDLGTAILFSLPVGLGVNCRSPRGSEEHQIAVDSTSKVN